MLKDIKISECRKNLIVHNIDCMLSHKRKSIPHELHFYFDYPLHKRLEYSKNTMDGIINCMADMYSSIKEAEESISKGERKQLREKLSCIEDCLSSASDRLVLLGSAFPHKTWKVTSKQFQLIQKESSHEQQ